MRVFVTGASGWVGSALVPELLQAGHDVVGLARSDASADAIKRAGAEVHRGSLADPDSLAEGAAKSDGVIHLAFIHEFDWVGADSQGAYDAANEADRRAIDVMGAALEGSDRPLVIASGMATTASGRPATEEDPAAPGVDRSRAATMTLSLADKGVRSAVVRLPPTTHGRGDNGFMSILIDVARRKRAAAYIGDGSNVWPAVHRSDAARVFRLALEQAEPATVWHAVGEAGVRTRDIAEVMGRHLELPVVPLAPGDAGQHFGWMGFLWGADIPASNALTCQRLRWAPSGPGLIEDLEAGHYFETA